MINKNEERAREIQANDVCCVWNGGCPNVRIGALEAMRWKDEQFEVEKQQWIDRACEWLQKHINDYLVKGRDIDYMFDDFRKAMEGGEK